MTSLSVHPPSNPSWTVNSSQARVAAYPNHFLARPLSSTSSRPLSVASTLSAVSITSSTSSLTGDRRRRSTALLDLEFDGSTPADEAVRNSIMRADQVLRASERERELERRRQRAGLRARQVVRSTHFVDQMDETSEELGALSRGSGAGIQRTKSTKRFSPAKLLKKARSIPVDMLLNPSPKRLSSDDDILLMTNNPDGYDDPSYTHQPSPAIDRSPTSTKFPRRAASVANLLSLRPTTPLQPSPSKPSPPCRSRYDTLPTRLTHLPVPAHEPTSKFSGSSGDSVVHLVSFGTRPLRLKERARTFSQASTSGFKTLAGKMKTPSKLTLRKKPSLAGIFRDSDSCGDTKAGKALDGVKQPRSFSRASSRIPTLSHRPSTSIDSFAPSIATPGESGVTRKNSSRLGFFRSALRDSTNTASTNSRRGSSGTMSPSLISRPVSTSTGTSSGADKRFSEVTAASEGSSGVEDKVGWASRIGRAVKGKNVAAKKAMFERAPSPVVQLAEKIKIPGSRSPVSISARPPSRIPISSVFPSQPTPPARPPRPSSALHSSDDTTFYGHRIPGVKAKAAVLDAGSTIESSAPRVRPKTSLAASKAKALQPLPSQAVEPSQLPSFEALRPIFDARSATVRASSRHLGGLLPSAEIHPAHSLPNRRFTFEASEASSDDTPSPRSSASLTPPSPPSTAGGPITEVRGATTDLADLLSGLDDTEELSRSVKAAPSQFHIQADVTDLSASLRQHLPHAESIESLRSTVSDVPDDLKQLINSVDDHISEIDVPSFLVEGYGMDGHGFADEGSDSSDSTSGSSDDDDEIEQLARPFALVTGFLGVADYTGNAFSSDGGTTVGFDTVHSTVSSFEGHVSTAAQALRSMLTGSSLPPMPLSLSELPKEGVDRVEHEERSTLRDSVREALEVGRPSAGDRMFDRVDSEVALYALLDGPSPPPSPEQMRQQRPSLVAASFAIGHFRTDSIVSSSEGSTESGFSIMNSPTPLPLSGRPVRQSLARYSQEHFPVHRPSHRARPVSEQSSGSSDQDHQSNEPTSLTLAQSSHSTNLSISSITSSPCPIPRRRVPMLTRQRAPPLQPSFRFPPNKPAVDEAKRTISTSPRFVRPLKPSRPGEPIPQPRLLETEDLDSVLIPPDTPPPSSPSVSDGERRSFSTSDSRPSSIEVEALFPTRSHGSRTAGHRRQTSRSSSIIQSTIVEEAESPVSSPPAGVEMAFYPQFQPLSPIQEPSSPCINEAISVPPIQLETNLFAVDFVLPPLQYPADSAVQVDDEESEDDVEFTAETNLEVTHKYVHLTYEAETDIRRSQTLWPDTDASLEAVASFDAPKTYFAILDFLFASQNRYPTPPHLIRLTSFVPLAFADPPTSLSPIAPVEIPAPIVDSPDLVIADMLTATPPSPEPLPLPPRKPAPCMRRPLAAKPVNPQVAALSWSTSSPKKEDALSPFTALPPRLGARLRGIRAKISPTKKKLVDTHFLGDSATRRRQSQFNAAMRMLEGTGKPEEQRSDEDTDDTGVLEAKGEATDEFTFTKTPRLTTSRPRVRRKTALSSLR
ncbi:hypothetical protein JCM1841_001281 [Sporobolomyces salmonicolor]